MTTFAWLVIGHLVGDWVLQNDWMAQGKRRGLLNPAGVVHFTIYTAAILGAFWLAGVQSWPVASYLALGVVVFLLHWLIDSTRLVQRWMHFSRQSDLETVRLMVDQTLHLLILAILAALV